VRIQSGTTIRQTGSVSRHSGRRLRRWAIALVAAASLATAFPATAEAFGPDEIIDAVSLVRPAQAQTPPLATQTAAVAGGAGIPADVAAMIPQSAFDWMNANGWKVEFRQGPGPGRQAEAQYATKTIVIWHTNNRPAHFWAGAFGHELGHAVGFVHLNSAQMQEWNDMRGLATWRWQPGMPNDFSVGEGDFAEAFMSYLLGHTVRSHGGAVTPSVANWISANTPF